MKRRTNGKPAETRLAPKQVGVATLLKLKTQHPGRERIRQRAYEICLARGGAPGRELDDWLQAERELREQSQPAADEASRRLTVNR